MEGVRSFLYDVNNNQTPNTSKSIQELWGEFLLDTVFVRNRVVTTKNKTTPYKKFFGRKPSVCHLRVLGCEAKVLTPEEIRVKIDPTCVTGWFVGYCDNIKDWRIWIPQLRKIIVSRDVKFNETQFIGDDTTSNSTEQKNNPCEPFRIVMEAMSVEQRLPLNEEEMVSALEQEEDDGAQMDRAIKVEQEEADQSEMAPRDNTNANQQEVARADTASPENPPANNKRP
jgi:hypothetical protein